MKLLLFRRIVFDVCCLCVFLVVSTANAMALFSSKSSTNRYFTHEGVLPPLALATLPKDSTTIPYSVSEASVIPFTYTNNPKTVYKWLSDNLPPEGCILGVDIEAVPRCIKRGGYSSPLRKSSPPPSSPFENAATVQLATTDACLVVHLAKNSGRFSHACAPILMAILSDERYIKAGCAIDGDFISLHETWGDDFEAKSRLDLGLIGIQSQSQNNDNIEETQQQQQQRNNRTRHGLKALCRSLLNIDLPKPKHLAMSDWSQVPLREDQIIYSARDAWAGAAIAQKLVEYDPETFAPSNLMHVLSEREPSIALLAERQKRRDKAKRDLTRLLKPYQQQQQQQQQQAAAKKANTKRKQHHHHHHRNSKNNNNNNNDNNGGIDKKTKKWLPQQVYERARDLRGVIKKRILDPQLVFETDHLDFEIV